MNIHNLLSTYSDENVCKLHFKQLREQQGIRCKHCGCADHYWLQGKWQWQCKGCSFRTTLRSGTMMQNSNLPFATWYFAMIFMTFSKKGMSAKELQRQLGHKRYDTVWSLMHRLRNTMGNRDDLYVLEGMVEFDEAYFSKASPDGVKLKRGKGSQRKQNVAVMAESIPLEDPETGQKSRQCRYFKMKVLETHKAEEIDETVEKSLDEKSFVFSDDSTSYVNISKYVEGHVIFKSEEAVKTKELKWVHIAISNAKRTLLGVYHKIKGKYLQLYLDEFCYKLNRRYFGFRLFDRICVALATMYW